MRPTTVRMPGYACWPPHPRIARLAVRGSASVAVGRDQLRAFPHAGTPGVRRPRRPVGTHRTWHIDRSGQPGRLDPGRFHAPPPRARPHRHADRLPVGVSGPAGTRPSGRVHGFRPGPRSPAHPHRPARARPRRAGPPAPGPRRRTPRGAGAATATARAGRRPVAGRCAAAVRESRGQHRTGRHRADGRSQRPHPQPAVPRRTRHDVLRVAHPATHPSRTRPARRRPRHHPRRPRLRMGEPQRLHRRLQHHHRHHPGPPPNQSPADRAQLVLQP